MDVKPLLIKTYYKLYNTFIDWLNDNSYSITYNYSNGVQINIDNKYYILTTATQFKNSLYSTLNDDKILEIIYISYEFNLALIKHKKCNAINYMDLEINDFRGNKLRYIDVNNKVINHRCNIQNINIQQLYNIHIGDIITVLYKTKHKHNILIGSYVYRKSLIGLISLINNEYLTIIPNYIINKFISNYIDNRKITTIPCKLMNNKIIDIYNSNNTLKKNDKIISINNNNVIDDMIYDKNIDINLPIQSYITLNYSSNDIINITVNRKKKIITIPYVLEYYNNYMYISYSYNYSNHKYKIEDDNIYIEVNDNILEQLYNYNYDVKKLMDKFVLNNYNKKKCIIKLNKNKISICNKNMVI